MIRLPYSLVIEATADPEFFSFYSPDLDGFTGASRSVEEFLSKVRGDMREFVKTLKGLSLRVPPPNPQPTILIKSVRKTEVA